MLTKDNNNVPVTINRRNPALQDNRRACPRRDTERRKFQRNKIQQVAQTTLRNNIGSSVFQDIYTILSKREEVKQHIKSVIASEAGSWGIEVTGV